MRTARSLTLLSLFACTGGTPDDTGDDPPPDNDPVAFHGLTCTPPNTWDPSSPDLGADYDLLITQLTSALVVPVDGDLAEQCVGRQGAGWASCAALVEERGFTRESLVAAFNTAYGEPLTPATPELNDIVTRCLLPEAPFEPDADVELTTAGWYHAVFGIYQVACPSLETPNTWGGDVEAAVFVAVDPAVTGCEADIAAAGWEITSIAETPTPVVRLDGLRLEAILGATWDELTAAAP